MNPLFPTAGPAPTVRERTRRSELLAGADRDQLLALAERCTGVDGARPEPVIGPEVGVVVLTVREPVESIRFHLGEVLVTRAEVAHRGERGWAMCLGDDPAAALAAAVCDAEAAAGGPLTAAIDDLCRWTEAARARDREREWAALEPTIVRFEEMG